MLTTDHEPRVDVLDIKNLEFETDFGQERRGAACEDIDHREHMQGVLQRTLDTAMLA